MEFYITGVSSDLGPLLRGRVFMMNDKRQELMSAFIYIHELEMIQTRNPAGLLRARAIDACESCLQMYRGTVMGLVAGRHLVGCRDCSSSFWCDCISGQDCPMTCCGEEDE